MSEWLEFIGAIMLIFGLPTALIDMGMNGSRYAGWAPCGLGMGFIGLLMIEISSRH